MRRRVGYVIFAAILLSACGVSWGQKKASVLMPADGAPDVACAILQWTAGSTAVSHTVYLGTTPDLGPANVIAPKMPLNPAILVPPILLVPGTTYYWRVDEIEKDLKTVITGDVWTFTLQAMTAYLPSPADGSNTVSVTPDLKWLPGQGAGMHHVYLSDSRAAVVDGAAEADRGVVTDPNYAPGELLPATAYFWRVDEILFDSTVMPGPIWSFATVLLIDDFESYTDEVTGRIFQTWIDGWGYTEPAPGNAGNGTGATVGYTDAPFAEQRTVHAGLQSMPMDYNNIISPLYSEAERTWDSPQDWTVNGVDTLTLFVHGQARDFDIPKATTPPVIDGKVDEAWAKASVQYINTLIDGAAVSGPKDCSGSFRSLYDSQNLYLLVDVNDEALVQDSDAAQGWLDDRVEIFIDGDNDKSAANDTVDDAQYCFRWNHAVVETPVEWYRSPGSLAGVQYGIAATSSGYLIEVKLPWSAMIGKPAGQGQSIGIDVMICDDDDGGDRDCQIAWYGGTPHVPNTWGTGRVGEAAANTPDLMYVALRDASNRTGIVTYPSADILMVKTWVEWKIPLSDFTGANVNLAAVRKMFIGVGNRVKPVQGGAGPLYFDDIYLTRPAPAAQ